MKKVKFVLASLSILMMVSCGKKETRSESESAIHPEEMQAGHEEIELNNGERWNVNEEMKPPVIASEDLFNHYMVSNRSDYQNLADDLKGNVNALIKSCTMQGKSHDELHKWLHPYIEQIEKLKQADSPEETDAVLMEIGTSFEIYHQYFQ